MSDKETDEAGAETLSEGADIRHVVLVFTDTDWTSVRRAASQHLRSLAENWLVCFVAEGAAGEPDQQSARLHDTAMLAQRVGAKAMVGSLDALAAFITNLRTPPESFLVVHKNGPIGECRRWWFERRLRKHIGKSRIQAVGVMAASAETYRPPVKVVGRIGSEAGKAGCAAAFMAVTSALAGWLLAGMPAELTAVVLLYGAVIAALVLGRSAGFTALGVGALGLAAVLYVPFLPPVADLTSSPILAFFYVFAGAPAVLIASRSLRRNRLARERQALGETIIRIARHINGTVSLEGLSRHLADELGGPLGATVHLLPCEPDAEDLDVLLAATIGRDVIPEDVLALRIAMNVNQPTGLGTSVANETIFHFHPVSAAGKVRAVIVLSDTNEDRLDDPKLQVLLETVADLCGIALERIVSVEAAESADVAARRDAEHPSGQVPESALLFLAGDIKNKLTDAGADIARLRLILANTGSQGAVELASKVQGLISHLETAAANVIHLSRLENTDPVIEKDSVDLVAVINSTVASMTDVLSGFTLVRRYVDQEPAVAGDASMIELVLRNLLGNAARYSMDGSSITISIEEVGHDLFLGIHDEGVGILEKDLERIFECFYKSVGARSDGYSAGLGLAICKKIAGLHAGRIWAESPGPGKGTKFFLSLPKAEIPASSIQPPQLLVLAASET
ncbi:ATP-binding protein [Hwanghaeella grinnelliae]|nr:ATP-binding protein [Hwanghaeella grinnelliae]